MSVHFQAGHKSSCIRFCQEKRICSAPWYSSLCLSRCTGFTAASQLNAVLLLAMWALCDTAATTTTGYADDHSAWRSPYFTVLVPDARVATIPPMEASAPGSTEKNSPLDLSSSFSCLRVTPAWTRQSISSAFTCNILR